MNNEEGSADSELTVCENEQNYAEGIKVIVHPSGLKGKYNFRMLVPFPALKTSKGLLVCRTKHDEAIKYYISEAYTFLDENCWNLKKVVKWEDEQTDDWSLAILESHCPTVVIERDNRVLDTDDSEQDMEPKLNQSKQVTWLYNAKLNMLSHEKDCKNIKEREKAGQRSITPCLKHVQYEDDTTSSVAYSMYSEEFETAAEPQTDTESEGEMSQCTQQKYAKPAVRYSRRDRAASMHARDKLAAYDEFHVERKIYRKKRSLTHDSNLSRQMSYAQQEEFKNYCCLCRQRIEAQNNAPLGKKIYDFYKQLWEPQFWRGIYEKVEQLCSAKVSKIVCIHVLLAFILAVTIFAVLNNRLKSKYKMAPVCVPAVTEAPPPPEIVPEAKAD